MTLPPPPVPRWIPALRLAATLDDVIAVVQQGVAETLASQGTALASAWRPQRLRSREDLEHWERRLCGHAARDAGLCALLACARERIDEVGPRRRPTR
jgi:hypothetical protein